MNSNFYKSFHYYEENPNIIMYMDYDGNYIKVNKFPSESMMIKEFKLRFPLRTVIEILDIYVQPKFRHSGAGSKLLRGVINIHDDKVIMLLAGASMTEYPELNEEKIPKILENLIPFYECNKFVNVNNIFGSYSMMVPMMYTGNRQGEEIADVIGVKKWWE